MINYSLLPAIASLAVCSQLAEIGSVAVEIGSAVVAERSQLGSGPVDVAVETQSAAVAVQFVLSFAWSKIDILSLLFQSVHLLIGGVVLSASGP